MISVVALCAAAALAGCGGEDPSWSLVAHPGVSAAEAQALVRTLRGEVPPEPDDSPWQARVAGVEITQADIDAVIDSRYRQLRESPPPGADELTDDFFRQQALASLVAGARLAAEARRLSVTPTRAQLNAYLRYAARRSQRAGFGDYLRQRNMTLDAWRLEVANNLLRRDVLAALLPPAAAVDANEARRALEQQGPEVDPGRRAVVVRYFDPGQGAQARALHRRIARLPATQRAGVLQRAGGEAIELPTRGGPPQLAPLARAAPGALLAPMTIAGRPAVVVARRPDRTITAAQVRDFTRVLAGAERARREQEVLRAIAERYPVRYAPDAPRPSARSAAPGE